MERTPFPQIAVLVLREMGRDRWEPRLAQAWERWGRRRVWSLAGAGGGALSLCYVVVAWRFIVSGAAFMPTPCAPSCHPCRSAVSACSEDVLWSALFALAVIARDCSANYIAHLLILAAAGVLPPLEAALGSYRQAVEEQVLGGCDMGCRLDRRQGHAVCAAAERFCSWSPRDLQQPAPFSPVPCCACCDAGRGG